MNKTILGIVAFTFLFLFGCGKKEAKVVGPISDQPKEEKHTASDKAFIEGALTFTVGVNDKVVNDFIQYAVEDPVQIGKMLDEYQSKVSAADIEHIKQFLANNPMFWRDYGLLPYVSNTVFMAGYEATYKGEALSYILENKWNDILDHGYSYVSSTVGVMSTANYNYSKPYYGYEQIQIKIDTLNYDRMATAQYSEMAGYRAQQIEYTLKPASRTKEFMRPEKVTVYVSGAMNGAMNKVLPFFVDEKYGVLQVEAKFNAADSFVIQMKVDTIVDRKISELESGVLATKVFFTSEGTNEINAFRLRLAKIATIPRM